MFLGTVGFGVAAKCGTMLQKPYLNETNNQLQVAGQPEQANSASSSHLVNLDVWASATQLTINPTVPKPQTSTTTTLFA